MEEELICDNCGNETTELAKCRSCGNIVCNECLVQYDQFNQIDYNLCIGCCYED